MSQRLMLAGLIAMVMFGLFGGLLWAAQSANYNTRPRLDVVDRTVLTSTHYSIALNSAGISAYRLSQSTNYKADGVSFASLLDEPHYLDTYLPLLTKKE